MKEDIEDFIKQNRASFDDESPSDGLWNRIEEEVFDETKSKIVFWPYFWKVAAVVFFVFSGFLLWQLNQTKSDALVAEETNGEMVDEFTATETYYMSEIKNMTVLVENFEDVDPTLTKSFKDDIDALDEQYNALKIELDENKNEQVINALILNLQLRMQILNKQIMILNNLKNSESNENVNI